MERNNTKLIVVSQHAMMSWGPIFFQFFEQCHCSDRFSVCGFEEFLLHREYGNPYIIVLDSEDDCLQAANILHNFSVCVMNYDLPVKLDTKKLDKCRVLTYSTSSDNADFTARNAHCIQEFGCAFEIVGVGVIGRIKLRTAEPDDVKTALMGASVCLACGIPFADVLTSLNMLAVGV